MINIRNIYYMLTYAFTALRKDEFRKCGSESFENIYDLLSSILVTGVKYQLRRGVSRSYKEVTEELRTVKGRIEIGEVIRKQSVPRGFMICTHDEFSVDEKRNRIIKATLLLLLKTDIPRVRRKEIRNILSYFAEVTDIDLHHTDWNIRYGRNDSIYRMLIEICRLIVNGLIQNHDGNTVMLDFLDERSMCTLYEKFILEYFRKEHPELKAFAAMIPWDVEGEGLSLLPTMNSDITLEYGNNILIIDAKYYSRIYGSYYDKKSWRSANMYQIYTYVKNKKAAFEGCRVSGMLLYAGTEEHVIPQSYKIGGDKISINVLDLNVEFSEIRKVLDDIAYKFESDPYSKLTDFIEVFDVISREGWTSSVPNNIVSCFIHVILALCNEDSSLKNYQEILGEYGLEWSSESMFGYDVAEADCRCLKVLIVALFRADHFSDGILEKAIEDGTVSRWLKRLDMVENNSLE